MSLRQYANAAYLAEDWEDEIDSKNTAKVGLLEVDVVDASLKAGSYFDVNGSIFKSETDTSITGSGWFVYCSAAGSLTRSDTIPTWSEVKRGWYNTTSRALWFMNKPLKNKNDLPYSGYRFTSNTQSTADLQAAFNSLYNAVRITNNSPWAEDYCYITGDIATSTQEAFVGANLIQPGEIRFVPFDGNPARTNNPSWGPSGSPVIATGSIPGSNKWFGGVYALTKQYFIPYNSDNIWVANFSTGLGSNISLGATGLTAKWNGGVLANGKIYCAPNSARDLLIIDVSNDTWTRSTLGATISGGEAWSNGSLGLDGKIYFPPLLSPYSVLVVDPVAGTATKTNYGLSLGSYGGAVLGLDGKIYCPPVTGKNFLVIDPASATAENTSLVVTLPGETNCYSGGGTIGPDGKLYFARGHGYVSIAPLTNGYIVVDTLNKTVTNFFLNSTGYNGNVNIKSSILCDANGILWMIPRDDYATHVIKRINTGSEAKLPIDSLLCPLWNKI